MECEGVGAEHHTVSIHISPHRLLKLVSHPDAPSTALTCG